MKKILSAITLGALLLPVAAFASSITLAPATIATTAGKSFSVTVGVNPTSGKAYTVRANLSFDPSAVELTGFTFAPKWMALPQEGYDTEDNTNGVMAKTGGYPGGITAPTTLGTATFKAKKSGTAMITATADSLILDAGNKNTVAGSQGSVQVTIAAAPAAPAPAPVTTETTPTTEGEEAVTATAAEDEAAPQTAAALSPFDRFITFGTGSPAVASLATIVVLLLVGGSIWLWRRERSQV